MKKNVLIFCLVIPLFLGACSSSKTDQEYLDAARDFYRNGNYDAATIELKNALQQNSLNAEARFLLGKIYLESGDGDSALKELQRAQDLNTRQPVVPLLARALLQQQEFQQVVDLEEPPALSDDDKSDLLVSKGIAYLSLDNREKALELFDSALIITPDSDYGLEGLARARIAEGDLDAAREWLKKILDKNDKYVPAWSLLGRVEQSTGNFQKAEEALGNAIELNPNNYDDIIARALVRISSNQISLAEQDLNSLPEQIAKHPNVNYAWGLIYLNRKEYDQAQVAFENVLNTTGDYAPALYYSSLTHFSLNQFEQAEEKLGRYIAEFPDFPPANRMLAIIKFQRGEFSSAEELLRKALAENPADQVVASLLADTLVAQNQQKEAVAILRSQVERTPDSMPARIALAKGYMLDNNLPAAIEQYNKVLEKEPAHTRANAQLVQIYLQTANNDEALRVANEFVESSEGSVNAYNLLATTNLSLGNEDQARNNFEKSLQINPNDYSANGGLAAMAVKAGEFEVAHGHYRKILEERPDDLGTLMNVADVYMAQKDPASARKIIEQAVETNPDALKPRIRLGWFYAKNGEEGKIPGLLSSFKEKNPDHVGLLILLADSAYSRNRFKEAEQLLLHIRELDPDNAGVVYSLAKTYAKLGKNSEYLETLKTALELNPEITTARIELTNYLVALKQIDEAQKHVDILNQRFRGGAEVLLLEGKIAETIGDYKAAVKAYEPIYNYTKNNVNLIRLTNAMWHAGDQDKALNMLNRWLEDNPDDVAIKLELAGKYILQERFSDAITLYESVLKHSKDNLLAQNNLAWLLKDKDNPRAIRYAENVYNKSGSPEAMDTYAQVLLSKGKKDDIKRAKRLLEDAIKAQPGNNAYLFHSAQVDVALGDRSSAVEKLEKVIADNDFTERQLAQDLLESLNKG